MGYKDVRIRKSEYVANTQFLHWIKRQKKGKSKYFLSVFNPIPAGGGVNLTPPPVVFFT